VLIGGNGAGRPNYSALGRTCGPTPTGREARTYRLGRRGIDLIEAKRRIAYIGAELQTNMRAMAGTSRFAMY